MSESWVILVKNLVSLLLAGNTQDSDMILVMNIVKILDKILDKNLVSILLAKII